ncbi:MAG: outer membrane beta-barrel protein [Paracoccus sp. (in: a-proteobacteria)]|nr:outer membrane beta-barrel protein [Paracoccus sp. (in: a-proteobacteria)]
MIRSLRLATLVTLALPAAAIAGGYTPPVIEAPVVIAPSEQVATPLWAGAYVGGALGYAFNGDDRVGMETVAAGSATPAGESLDVSGAAGTLALGYRWQRNKFVYGPELTVDFGGVEDDYANAENGSTFDDGGKSEVNHIISLKFKGGSLVNEQTLVYGLAGVAYGDFTYTQGTGDGAQSVDYDATRYVIGAGVERKVSERLSVFGEWNYYNFGKTDVFFPASDDSDSGVQTVATPEHHLIKIGLNYQF